MQQRLKNRVAIVTGGARGLGLAIVERFVAEDAFVMIGDLQIEAESEYVRRFGERVIARQLDVADETSFHAAIDCVVRKWSRLDILVNNAGIAIPIAPVQSTTNEQFQRLIDVNMRGVWHGCKLAYPHLKTSRGCVLNISSMAGITGQSNHAIYSATKGAINALTKSTAVDWGSNRVRINSLCPAGVWTDALHEWCQSQPDPEETEDYLSRIHSLGYCPDPEEIASVAAFLCSDEASFMTGAIVPVSGGSECGYKL